MSKVRAAKKVQAGVSVTEAPADDRELVAGVDKCLTCPATGKLKRGLCKTCHRVALYQINIAKSITDKDAVEGGLILPGGHGGKQSAWTKRAKAFKEQKRKQKSAN